MKKIFSSALAILLIIGTTEAQDVKHKGEKGHHKQEQRKEMYKDLDLSKAQKAKMEDLRKEYKKDMADLKSNSSLSDNERLEKRRALGKDFRMKSESILTTQQKGELAKMRTDRKIEGKSAHYNKGNKRGVENGRRARMHDLKEELNLSPDQDQKVSSIKANYKSKFDAIRKNESLSAESKKDKMIALRMSQQKEIRAVLTPEQIEKMKSGRKEHQNKNTK